MNEIEELYYRKEISTRSLNVCHLNRLDSLEKLKKHFNKYGEFQKLNNCGGKSNQELVDLCKKYSHIQNLWDLPEFKDLELDEFIKKLSTSQKYSFSVFAEKNCNQIDNRTKNAICLYLDNDYSLDNLIKKQVLKKHFPVNQIQGLGKKSTKIAKDIFLQLRKDLLESKFNNLNGTEKNRIFSIYSEHLPKELVEELSLEKDAYFKNIQHVLNSDLIFTKTEKQIIKHKFVLYNVDDFMTPREFYEKFGFNNDEVNPMKSSILTKFKKYFAFLKDFKTDFELTYSIDSKGDVLSFNHDIFSDIRKSQGISFSNGFLSYLIGMVFCGEYKNVGYYKSCLSKLIKRRIKSNSKFHFKIYYQVKTKLAKKCNFGGLLSTLSNQQIELNSISDEEKIALVQNFTTSHIDQTKLRLFNCAQYILTKENTT